MDENREVQKVFGAMVFVLGVIASFLLSMVGEMLFPQIQWLPLVIFITGLFFFSLVGIGCALEK